MIQLEDFHSHSRKRQQLAAALLMLLVGLILIEQYEEKQKENTTKSEHNADSTFLPVSWCLWGQQLSSASKVGW